MEVTPSLDDVFEYVFDDEEEGHPSKKQKTENEESDEQFEQRRLEFNQQGFNLEQMYTNPEFLNNWKAYFLDQRFRLQGKWHAKDVALGDSVKVLIPTQRLTGEWTKLENQQLCGGQARKIDKDYTLVLGEVVNCVGDGKSAKVHLRPKFRSNNDDPLDLYEIERVACHRTFEWERQSGEGVWCYTYHTISDSVKKFEVRGETEFKLFNAETNTELERRFKLIKEYGGRGLCLHFPVNMVLPANSHRLVKQDKHIDFLKGFQIDPTNRSVRGLYRFSPPNKCVRSANFVHEVTQIAHKMSHKGRTVKAKEVTLEQIRNDPTQSEFYEQLKNTAGKLGESLICIIKWEDALKTVQYRHYMHFQQILSQMHGTPQTPMPFDKQTVMLHGFPYKNLRLVLERGLQPGYCKRGAYGPGVYASKNPERAIQYAHWQAHDSKCAIGCVALLSTITGIPAIVKPGEHKSWTYPLLTQGPPSRKLTGVPASCTTSDEGLDCTAFQKEEQVKIEYICFIATPDAVFRARTGEGERPELFF